MKYPPKHHQETKFENVVETIKRFPLATLISAKNDVILTSHIPLMYEETQGEFGALIGHIDKYNPQAELLQKHIPAQAIFHGPNSYISPKVYSSEQLPTWNYIKVHISAKAIRITNKEEVIASIARMTSFMEKSNQPYVLDSQSRRVQSLADYIIGFKLEITAWEGKFKLSQDKSPTDKALAKKALIEENQKDITNFVNSICN